MILQYSMHATERLFHPYHCVASIWLSFHLKRLFVSVTTRCLQNHPQFNSHLYFFISSHTYKSLILFHWPAKYIIPCMEYFLSSPPFLKSGNTPLYLCMYAVEQREYCTLPRLDNLYFNNIHSRNPINNTLQEPDLTPRCYQRHLHVRHTAIWKTKIHSH